MSTDVYRERDIRARDWYGWFPSQARVCPMVVLGRRHRDEGCICDTYGNLLDHAAVWIGPQQTHIYTFEPYQAAGDDLAAFVLDMKYRGMEVWFTGRSLWHDAAFMGIVRNGIIP